MKITEEFAVIDGIKTHYFKMGHGNPVILLHGWPYPFRPDELLPQKLAESFTVYFFDLPGFGKSNSFRARSRLNRFSEFIEKFMEQLAIEKPIIISFSLGGIIALNYAVKRQKKLAGLVVVASTNSIAAINSWIKNPVKVLLWVYDNLLFARPLIKKTIKSEVILKNFWKLIEPRRDVNDQEVRRTIESIKKVKIPVTRNLMEDVLHWDVTKECKKIKIPTLLLAGEKDTIFPHRLTRQAFQSIPDATFILVPEAVHSQVINEHSMVEIVAFVKKIFTNPPAKLSGKINC